MSCALLLDLKLFVQRGGEGSVGGEGVGSGAGAKGAGSEERVADIRASSNNYQFTGRTVKRKEQKQLSSNKD